MFEFALLLLLAALSLWQLGMCDVVSAKQMQMRRIQKILLTAIYIDVFFAIYFLLNLLIKLRSIPWLLTIG